MEELRSKLVFIGDSGVGKTSLIKRKNTDVYDESEISTTGVSYYQVRIKLQQKSVNFDCWDTAGQEKFRSLGKSFYKDAYVIAMVYDTTRKKSYENLKNVWYEDVKTVGEKYNVLLIVGTKCDLIDEEQVKEEEARAWAKQINAGFVLTSAKANTGIEQLFTMAAELFLDPDFLKKYNEIQTIKERTKSIILSKEKHKDEDNDEISTADSNNNNTGDGKIKDVKNSGSDGKVKKKKTKKKRFFCF